MALTQVQNIAYGVAINGGTRPSPDVGLLRYNYYDGYVTFDLSALSPKVTSATFSVSFGAEDQYSNYAHAISLHDVTSTGVFSNVDNPELYNDLATGDLYGGGTVSPADFNTVYTFQLTQAALDDLNAAITNNTKFSIGLSNETPDPNNYFNNLFGFYGREATLHLNTVDGGPTQFADNLIGTNDANTISALQGNDTVSALFGNDTVYGNQGNDVLYGNQGSDQLYGGQDNDTIYGGQDGDYVEGNFGADVLYGNFGSDTIFGGRDNDTIYGGQDNDFLNGGLGNDLLVGGLGADRFFFTAGQGNDVVSGFSAVEGDRLDLGGQGYSLGADANGQAALFLSGGGTIVIQGYTPEQFSAGFVA